MFSLSNHYHSSSDSGDSLSDSFLDTKSSRKPASNNLKALKAGDLSFGLASLPYISTSDQHFSRLDSAMREIFLTSQPHEAHGHLPKVDYLQPDLHSPSHPRTKNPHFGSGDINYTPRLNHHTHTTLPPLPQLITENLDSAVDTSMLMASSMGYVPEPNSASSSEESPPRETEQWPGSGGDFQNDHPSRPRKPRREKPRIQLAPDQPPTTQGKPRSRVYVACVQWYVNN
jgi:hypothetical protein